MAASRKSPRDLTGRKAEILAEENAREIEKNKGRITTVNVPDIEVEPVVADADPVEVGSDKVKMRVNTDLEQVTIGRGNFYDFYRDRIYTVSRDVYEHLDRLGYVYH